MAGGKILVVGGSGFVGRHVVNRLVSIGYRVVVPTRRRESARELFLLPTVNVVEVRVCDVATLTHLAQDAAAVINLVGIVNETRGNTFTQAHVEVTRFIIAACKAVGVRRLLQMSSLNADASGPSRYLRSKAEAEGLVAASELDWTIFQPSVIFGPGDSFLNLFAQLSRRLPILALGSPTARFQPVYVGDVASGFVHAITDDATVGQRYPLCGPKTYTLLELVRYVGETADVVRPILTLGPALSKFQALVLECLPGKLLTRDNLASMQKDSVCNCPFPAVFGFAPATLEAVVPGYLAPVAARSPYDEFRARSGR